MHRLIALYHPPASEDGFRRHLVDVHLPLVAKFPGVRAIRYGFGARSGDAAAPWFAVVECDFEDEYALCSALASPEAAAAADDVPNYAGAGVLIVTLRLEAFELAPTAGVMPDG